MANIKIGMDGLERAVTKILSDLPPKADEALDNAAKTVSKKAVDELKATSPIGSGKKSGSYARGWTTKKQKNETIVYNKTDYGLTHLLEYGHEIVIYGKATGKRTRAISHIKPVEEMVQEEYPKEFEKELEKLL